MKRLIAMILVVVSLFAFTCVFTGCGESADYSSVQAMSEAYAAGEDIVGKTVDLYASHDYYMGQIFGAPMPNHGPMVYIDVTGDGVENIKKSEAITVRITKVVTSSELTLSLDSELVD